MSVSTKAKCALWVLSLKCKLPSSHNLAQGALAAGLCTQAALCASAVVYASVVTRHISDACVWWGVSVGVAAGLLVAANLALSGAVFGAWRLVSKHSVAPNEWPSYLLLRGTNLVQPSNLKYKIFIGCGSALVFIAFVISLFILIVVAINIPDDGIPAQIPGLYDEVDITYDSNGVPHIYARNLHDGVMSIALVHSRDRLWQMEMSRRIGLGTISEILGNATLDDDIAMRTLGINRAVKRSVATLSNESRAILQAYCDGVNAFLDTDPQLPLEFTLLGVKPRRWELEDTISWLKVIDLYMAHDIRRQGIFWNFLTKQGLSYSRIMELYPAINRTATATTLSLEDMANGHGPTVGEVCPASEIDPPEMIDYINSFIKKMPSPSSTPTASPSPTFHNTFSGGVEASNNWVVHGNITGTGPILANDPHLQFSSPAIWYQVHLVVEGQYDIYEATFPGFPLGLIGKTTLGSWGVTNGGVDVQDLYVIDTDQNDPSRYIYNGSSLSFITETEEILVKDSSPYILNVRLTQDAMPILTDNYMDSNGDTVLALKWATIDPTIIDTTMDALSMINFNLSDWESFTEAVSLLIGPVLNLVFTSSNGDIGYRLGGLVPQRRSGYSGKFPVPGNGSYEWTGYIPFDELPWSRNPPKGWLATANNMITPVGYEKPGCILPGCFDVHFREQRISDSLRDLSSRKLRNITAFDMQNLQMDSVSMRFQSLIPVLQQLQLHPELLSAESQDWVDNLLLWDGVSSIGSHEAAVFNSWAQELLRVDKNETGQDQWGSYFNAWMHIVSTFTGQENNPGCEGDCTAFAARAFNNAFKRVGSSDQWGVTVHQAAFNHLVMNSAPSPIRCVFNRHVADGGDCDTVQSACPADSDDMQCTAGPGFRAVFSYEDDAGEGIMGAAATEWMLSLGQSGNPLSSHYDDMMKVWSQGQLFEATSYTVESTYHISPR
ncbi:penicillin acylase family protein [Pelomyxa schiedti]|nr:penicillin acylase family protein [Pelomyxa schiedti]